MNILVDKTILAIYKSDDNEYLKFNIVGSEEPVVASCYGDCCSHTWIEHIENASNAIGSPVLEAQDIDMPDLGNMPDKDVVAYYGFRIRTAKGDCIIDFRNNSNGYYGGNLEWAFGSGSGNWKLVA